MRLPETLAKTKCLLSQLEYDSRIAIGAICVGILGIRSMRLCLGLGTTIAEPIVLWNPLQASTRDMKLPNKHDSIQTINVI